MANGGIQGILTPLQYVLTGQLGRRPAERAHVVISGNSQSLDDVSSQEDEKESDQDDRIFPPVVQPLRLGDVPPEERHQDAEDGDHAHHVEREGAVEEQLVEEEVDEEVLLREHDRCSYRQNDETPEYERMEYAWKGLPERSPLYQSKGQEGLYAGSPHPGALLLSA